MKYFTLKNKVDQFLFILLAILPLTISTGPAIPNAIVTLIVLFFIILNHKLIFKTNKNITYLFYFSFYLLFISLLSTTKLFSFWSSISYLRYGFFIIAISYILEKNENFKILFWLLFSFFIFLFFDLVYQIINKKNLLGFLLTTGDRVTGIFGSSQVAGSFTVRLLPVLLFLLSVVINKNDILKLFIFFVSLTIVILSGERTSLFLYIIFFIYFLIIEKDLKFLLFSSSTVILVAAILFIAFPSQKKRFYDQTINQLFNKETLEKKNFRFFSERHQDHFETAINIFKKNMFFGSGPNSFRYLCSKTEYSVASKIISRNQVLVKFNGIIKLEAEKIYYKEKDILMKELKATLIYNDGIIEEYTIPKNSKFALQNGDNFKKDDVLYEKYFEYPDGCNTHPHNFILQILAETGLSGFLFYVFFLIKIYIFIFRNIYFLYFRNIRLYSKNFMYLIGSILINFFPFITSGNFFNSKLCIIFCIPLGLLYFLNKNKDKNY
jgi:O-antigen ligase